MKVSSYYGKSKAEEVSQVLVIDLPRIFRFDRTVKPRDGLAHGIHITSDIFK